MLRQFRFLMLWTPNGEVLKISQGLWDHGSDLHASESACGQLPALLCRSLRTCQPLGSVSFSTRTGYRVTEDGIDFEKCSVSMSWLSTMCKTFVAVENNSVNVVFDNTDL